MRTSLELPRGAFCRPTGTSIGTVGAGGMTQGFGPKPPGGRWEKRGRGGRHPSGAPLALSSAHTGSAGHPRPQSERGATE